MAEGAHSAEYGAGPVSGPVLGIDTCGPSGSVALGRLAGGGVKILEQKELAGRSYSATLVSAIGELLAGAGLRLKDVAAIVAVSGPGSFTGVRVGLSTVKGLAEVSRIAVVAVSRLEVLAWKTSVQSAALDAHRHEVFLRLGKAGGEAHEILAGADELAAIRPAPARVAVCDAAADLLRNAWPGTELVRVVAPMAADALQLCAHRVMRGEFVDLALLDGHYLRRSGAEIFGEPGAVASHPGRKNEDAARMGYPEQVRIRATRVGDLPRVMEIEKGLKDAPHWTLSTWQAVVDPSAARPRVALVAEKPATGAVLGFAVAAVTGPEAELESIGGVAERQRRGVARLLFGDLTGELRKAGVCEVYLEVRASNLAARALYEALGFAESGRRARYYADPEEDAVLMRLRLD